MRGHVAGASQYISFRDSNGILTPDVFLFEYVGDVEALLQTYDSDRLPLPAPYNDGWKWGWTKSAEKWNGRIAMIAIMVILAVEILTGQSVVETLTL